MSILYQEKKTDYRRDIPTDYIEVLAEKLIGEYMTYVVITINVKTTIPGESPKWINKSKLLEGSDADCIREAIHDFDIMLENHPNKDKIR